MSERRFDFENPRLKITIISFVIFFTGAAVILCLMAGFAMRENTDVDGNLVYTSLWTTLYKEKQNIKSAGLNVDIPVKVTFSVVVATTGTVVGFILGILSIVICGYAIRNINFSIEWNHKFTIVAAVSSFIAIFFSILALYFAWQVTDPEWFAKAMSIVYNAA